MPLTYALLFFLRVFRLQEKPKKASDAGKKLLSEEALTRRRPRRHLSELPADLQTAFRLKKKLEKLDQKNCYISTSGWKHCLEAGQKDLYSLQILRDKQMLDLYCQRNGLSSARRVEEVLDLCSVHNNVQINDDFFKADRPEEEGPVCSGRSGSEIDVSCKADRPEREDSARFAPSTPQATQFSICSALIW